ncbi:MAG: serine hydrolase domain-containing protein [Cyclobacteriaceae bacterium]
MDVKKNLLMGLSTDKVQRIVSKSIDRKNILGMVICLSKNDEVATFAAGNMTENQQYFIASVSKLYTSSIAFKLADNGTLKLDDRISKYLSEELIEDLHIYKGVDYSKEITIRHLLSNTSGLPDYFEQKQSNGRILKNDLIRGVDVKLTFEDIIKLSKEMSSVFPPGKKGHAFYSDTNYQILGQIIEKVSGSSMAEAYQKYIFDPLDLRQTYLYQDIEDGRPADLYYKNKVIRIPKIMSSFTSDGGIVSTARENMTFLKAFFQGQLFSLHHFDEMYRWNRIFYPFKYGMGVARFKFFGTYELLGHPGASGSFAFYCPKKDAFITGTINQIHKPGLPYRSILKILQTIK